MGWNHKQSGLKKDGTLYLSETVDPEDAKRLVNKANESKAAEKDLHERFAELIFEFGAKWG